MESLLCRSCICFFPEYYYWLLLSLTQNQGIQATLAHCTATQFPEIKVYIPRLRGTLPNLDSKCRVGKRVHALNKQITC